MSRGAGREAASRLWRAPLRALCRARDLYVRCLNGCAEQLPPDTAFGYGAMPMSRSGSESYYGDGFSSTSSARRSSYGADDADLRELVRAASERRRAERDQEPSPAPAPAAVPRSQSVAMARIDEDRPSDFDGAAAAAAYGRSRSYAVSRPGAGARKARSASRLWLS